MPRLSFHAPIKMFSIWNIFNELKSVAMIVNYDWSLQRNYYVSNLYIYTIRYEIDYVKY